MINLKDKLTDNVKRTIEFCKLLEKIPEEDRQAMIIGYLYSNMVSSLILENVQNLETIEEINRFLIDLETQIENDDDGFDTPPFMSGPGGASA